MSKGGVARVKILLACFAALCIMILCSAWRAGAGLPDGIGRPLSGEAMADVVARNSDMANYVQLSPNADFPREGAIDRITVHHMAANLTLEDLGDSFAERDRAASSNYAIDVDGNVALYVEERNRPWTSSSPENDHRAVTIEVANDAIGGNWHVSDASYEALVDLCADICIRNGIGCLEWTGDDTGNLTVHSMFSDTTECPGPYLLGKMPDLADRVNARLVQDD